MLERWNALGMSAQHLRQNMVGWLIGIEQNAKGITATLASYDHHRLQLGGIPAFSFLVAFPKDEDGALLLLRLVGSTPLRQDLVKETLVQHYQSIPVAFANPTEADSTETVDLKEKSSASQEEDAQSASQPDAPLNPNALLEDALTQGLDPHTHSFLSFGGWMAQVLGSLYHTTKNNKPTIAFGADIEFLPSACLYTVAMPSAETLAAILSIVKRSKPAPNAHMMETLGFPTNGEEKPRFQVGELRYSATQNLQPNKLSSMPQVCYNFDELIAQRTAVFGMTRTGKSNMIKNLISQLHTGAAVHNVHLGQLVFDINGEYANINNQDNGSLGDAFGKHAVRFAQGATARRLPGVFELLPDFYSDLQLGLTLIQRTIREKGGASSESFTNFMAMQFAGNHGDDEGLAYMRKYLYRTLLSVCGYKYNPAKGFSVFDPSKVMTENKSGFSVASLRPLYASRQQDIWFPKTFEEAVKWINDWIGTTVGKDIFDELHPELSALINLIRRKAGDIRITGIGYISMCVNQHCPNDDTQERLKGDELLEHVRQGRLVIIDLSGSSPSSQIMLMRELAERVFSDYVCSFTNPDPLAAKNPPCLIYIEEAHNMLGKNIPIDDVWPRIAKEGSKYGLGLCYATQEPSSVQTNILSNTENMVVCHLNNTREVAEISNFFDFEVFANSIVRLQEPGFVRLKQRDMPFVVPVQVARFDVEKVQEEINKIDEDNPAFMTKVEPPPLPPRPEKPQISSPPVSPTPPPSDAPTSSNSIAPVQPPVPASPLGPGSPRPSRFSRSTKPLEK